MQQSSVKSRSSASGAAEILRQILGDIEHGLHLRLWDGSALSIGREVLPVTLTFTSLNAFKRVLLNPEANAFAEAYCDGEIEVDGDLFEAMKAADSFDTIELTTMQKFMFALRIWKLSE